MNVIINYNAGNLYNLKNALDFLKIPNQITSTPKEILSAERILFPGVGAFQHAIDNLNQSGMREAIFEKISQGTPFLGICIGLQLLFTESQENGIHQGLDLISGTVTRFNHNLKIPQIGWNQVEFQNDPLVENIPNHSFFYFVHSYHVTPSNSDITLGTTNYGQSFTSMIRYKNIWGVQFHPEKSQTAGLQILSNFCSIHY